MGVCSRLAQFKTKYHVRSLFDCTALLVLRQRCSLSNQWHGERSELRLVRRVSGGGGTRRQTGFVCRALLNNQARSFAVFFIAPYHDESFAMACESGGGQHMDGARGWVGAGFVIRWFVTGGIDLYRYLGLKSWKQNCFKFVSFEVLDIAQRSWSLVHQVRQFICVCLRNSTLGSFVCPLKCAGLWLQNYVRLQMKYWALWRAVVRSREIYATG
jgi:hypothetical protein